MKPPTLPAAYVPPSLPMTLRTTASAISHPTELEGLDVDREPEDEEEERAEDVAEA